MTHRCAGSWASLTTVVMEQSTRKMMAKGLTILPSRWGAVHQSEYPTCIVITQFISCSSLSSLTALVPSTHKINRTAHKVDGRTAHKVDNRTGH